MAENEVTGVASAVTIVCPKCGKVCANAHGLACHIGRCGTAKANKKPQGKAPGVAGKGRGKASAAGDVVGVVREIFAEATAAVAGQAQVVEELLKGYETYVASLKRLRLAYMKNRARLGKLRGQAASYGKIGDEVEGAVDDE